MYHSYQFVSVEYICSETLFLKSGMKKLITIRSKDTDLQSASARARACVCVCVCVGGCVCVYACGRVRACARAWGGGWRPCQIQAGVHHVLH